MALPDAGFPLPAHQPAHLLCGCPSGSTPTSVHTVRLIGPDGAGEVCTMHAIATIGRAEQGELLTILIDTPDPQAS